MTAYRAIEAFLRKSGMAPTRFGRVVAGDPRLVHDLRRGRAPGARMQRRILDFIAAQED
jgi:hypothetical protein